MDITKSSFVIGMSMNINRLHIHAKTVRIASTLSHQMMSGLECNVRHKVSLDLVFACVPYFSSCDEVDKGKGQQFHELIILCVLAISLPVQRDASCT